MTSKVVSLPTYDECAEAVAGGYATHLQTFIYNNEPSDTGIEGFQTEAEFRKQLALMIEYERQPLPVETSCVGWIDCGERLPAHGLKVMAFYRNQLGKGRTVFAQHIEKFKDCADNYDYEPDFPEEFFDTDESGTSWVPEGWYEVTETHENNLQISDAITHWRPLLAAPEHPKTTPAHIVKQEPLT